MGSSRPITVWLADGEGPFLLVFHEDPDPGQFFWSSKPDGKSKLCVGWGTRLEHLLELGLVILPPDRTAIEALTQHLEAVRQRAVEEDAWRSRFNEVLHERLGLEG